MKKSEFIDRYKRFIEKENGLYLLRILWTCDLSSPSNAPNEFGPLYAAFYNLYSSDTNHELFQYFSGQVDTIDKHQRFHRFYEMLHSNIRKLNQTYECVIDEESLNFPRVKEKPEDVISIPELILSTAGSKRSIPSVLNDYGISKTKVKSYTDKQRRALAKLYERLYYNTSLGISTIMEPDGSSSVYDFCSEECMTLMDNIILAYNCGKDPLAYRDSRLAIKEYFEESVLKSLDDVYNDFYETLMSDKNIEKYLPRQSQNEFTDDVTLYKRILSFDIKRAVNVDGEEIDICTSFKQKYTSYYELRVGGQIIQSSKEPYFELEPGIVDNYPIQLIGISTDNEIFLAASAAQAGLYSSKYTAFISLLESGRTSELRNLISYICRIRNAIDTLRAINPQVYSQIEDITEHKYRVNNCLVDVYFLVSSL